MEREINNLWDKINKIGGGDFWRKLNKKEFELAIKIFNLQNNTTCPANKTDYNNLDTGLKVSNKETNINTITSTDFCTE